MDYLINQPPPKGAVLALGVFDGVHLGHQKLIFTVQNLAKQCQFQDCPSGAISFWPHPQKFFAPKRPFHQLTSVQEQEELMYSLGLDYFGFFHFTKEFADLSATEFAQKVLGQILQVKGVVVGFNFRYGAGNKGDSKTLEDAGSKWGFSVNVVPPVTCRDAVVSSTRIRELILQGDVAQAKEFLGRPYSIQGSVIHGRGRGHGLGYPTINLEFPAERVPPAPGVYAGRVQITADIQRPAAIFVGSPVTFAEEVPTVEANLLDWNQELYGKQVKLEFLQRLRSIVKFSSAMELKDQIKTDIARIRKLC